MHEGGLGFYYRATLVVPMCHPPPTLPTLHVPRPPAPSLCRYMDSGGDPAPYVTLRLRDSDATREMGWPHKFELLYKVWGGGGRSRVCVLPPGTTLFTLSHTYHTFPTHMKIISPLLRSL